MDYRNLSQNIYTFIYLPISLCVSLVCIQTLGPSKSYFAGGSWLWEISCVPKRRMSSLFTLAETSVARTLRRRKRRLIISPLEHLSLRQKPWILDSALEKVKDEEMMRSDSMMK